MSNLKYISDYYNVPARRGAAVRYRGKAGVVTGASGPHIRVRLEDEPSSRIYHPTDVEWPNLEQFTGYSHGET